MNAFRWIGLAAGVLVALAALVIAAGALWLNSFIHSDAFRQTLEERAGQSLGATVKIERVDFSLLKGIELEGLATQLDPAHAGGQGALKVSVGRVRCTYAWTELLQRRLKLTGVTLDQPQVVLTREAVAPAAETSAPTPLSSADASGPATSSPGAASSFTFVLDRTRVNNGTVSVRDAGGASMVDLQGLNAEADTSGYLDGKDVTGTLKVATVALPGKAALTDFSTPFTDRAGAVEARPFSASAFGGNLRGGYSSGTNPSVLDLNLKGADLGKVNQQFDPGSSRRLSGSLDLQSKWRGVEAGALAGEGDAQVTGGRLEGVKILDQLAQILRINELRDPAITQAQTHFVVAGGRTRLTGLEVDSPVFRLTGDGVIGADGGLNLNLVLALKRGAMGKLPSQLAASFVQQSDGSGSIAFQVTGSTANPQTDLPTRLLMQNTQIKSVIDKALNKFFH